MKLVNKTSFFSFCVRFDLECLTFNAFRVKIGRGWLMHHCKPSGKFPKTKSHHQFTFSRPPALTCQELMCGKAPNIHHWYFWVNNSRWRCWKSRTKQRHGDKVTKTFFCCCCIRPWLLCCLTADFVKRSPSSACNHHFRLSFSCNQPIPFARLTSTSFHLQPRNN